MPFSPFVAQTKTYDVRDDGHYVLNTLQFGDPDNSFVIRGATPKGNPLRASASRLLQKDVVVGGDTLRKQATVTLGIVTPDSGFTATELRSLVTDLAEAITLDVISQLLMGKS